VRDGWAGRLARKMHPFPALQEAIDDVFNARIGDVSGRGKLGADMREIWMMQPRFEKRVGSTPFSLVEQPRFRAAFDFMRLRADAGEVDVVLADWWQEFSQADDDLRDDLVAQLREEQQKHQRRVRSVRPPAPPARADFADSQPPAAAPRDDDFAPEGASHGGEAEGGGGGDAPRKRRRRRRRPGGGQGDGAAPGGEPAGGA
jgi:poly(A) polymerase